MSRLLRIAISSPLRRCFDYLPPIEGDPLVWQQPGIRVKVPFGRGGQERVGVVVAVLDKTDVPVGKLKRVIAVIDDKPIFSSLLLQWCQWISDYYHHSLGDVLFTALPKLLREDCQYSGKTQRYWQLTALGQSIESHQLKRAPKQMALLQLLHDHPQGVTRDILFAHALSGSPLKAVQKKEWIECVEKTVAPILTSAITQPGLTLNAEQALAVQQISDGLGKFQPFLLYGITGSGKTEVYLQVIAKALQQNKQVLILIPEISLTPQTAARFMQRFSHNTVILHSALSDKERLESWYQATTGAARIIIGTRSAVFVPLPELGLLVVDEEHDASFKQQEGLRYHARDIAMMRARYENVPIVLGSATPVLETWLNAKQKRYDLLALTERAGVAKPALIGLVDTRLHPVEEGLSFPVINKMREHITAGHQVLVFLNRRGFSPTWMCFDCGHMAQCKHCDARLTVHLKKQLLICHHCGWQRMINNKCEKCASSALQPVGQGTERLEQALSHLFSDKNIIRIDSDTITHKGALVDALSQIHDGECHILLGTQMLAKGHHFPNVTLVVIIDADTGLFSADFRGTERLSQLVLQVAGRSGRGEHAGEVLIQTRQIQHPLWQQLLSNDYTVLADNLLNDRELAHLPPCTYLALLRAEAKTEKQVMGFLKEIKILAQGLNNNGVELLGPAPAPMEWRAGRFRAQLLLRSKQRNALHALLSPWVREIEALKSAAKLRWNIDVDPIELY